MNTDISQTISLSQLQDSVKVGVMAVDTAVRKKSPQMKYRIILFAIIDSSKKAFIVKEVYILN